MSDQAPGTLTCPKCQSPMRTYERSGVTVDQCTSCRGIFLDRGELERLVDAEDTHDAQQGGPYAGRGHDAYEQGPRRRRGFMGGLFDD